MTLRRDQWPGSHPELVSINLVLLASFVVAVINRKQLLEPLAVLKLFGVQHDPAQVHDDVIMGTFTNRIGYIKPYFLPQK